MEHTLVPLPKNSPDLGTNEKVVQAALSFLGDVNDAHTEREGQWEMIQALAESAFEVYKPTGNKKITSKILQQIFFKAAGKMKPLDWTLHGTGTPEEIEKLTVDGVSTIMDRGHYARCHRDKGGIFQKLLYYGDAFLQVGTNADKTFMPLQYSVPSLSDVYVDERATDLRSPVSGMGCNEIVLIYRYSWEEFYYLYPKHRNRVALGEIPRSHRQRKAIERSWQQEKEQKNVIEVAHYFNLGAKVHAEFAGGACTLLSKKEGDKYPYIMNDEPYLPIIHYKCFPSTEGFYNYGIGHLFYDLAVVSAKMDNMAFRHAMDNIDPAKIANIPQGKSSMFFQKIMEAEKMRAQGKDSYIVQEFSPDNPASRATLETWQTAPITGEWERAFSRLDQHITRLGFQLDAVDRGASTTATQILAEEENADAAIKQIMEWNASESRIAVDMSIDMIRKTVDSDDITPINSTTTVEVQGQEIDSSAMTYGMIAENLRQYSFFTKVNSRSGTVPSNIMKNAQIANAMSMVPPGSPAHYKLLHQGIKLNDVDIKQEELMPQAPAQATEDPQMNMMTGTDEAKALPASDPNAGKIPV